MPFVFEKTFIDDLIIITPKIFSDKRGFFYENFKQSDFEKAGIKEKFIQDNHSLSAKGTIRGLHFQKKPFEQGKLVRCTKGCVWDVAVDLRKNSETFRKYFSIELSEENRQMLYIPPGFAHGFLALSDNAEFLYKCTKEYSPEADAGIRWNDPEISIKWPIDEKDIIISEKDALLPLLNQIKKTEI
jgi:dTDP-4-dehydrorhamnose 3,5-epimerase